MYKKILLVIIIILVFILTPTKINKPKRIIADIAPKINIKLNTREQEVTIKNEEIIGEIQIPKINLSKALYKQESKLNNVEENVTILKVDLPNIIVLAAHSGTGKNAYFKDLNKLKINDTVNLKYIDNNYKYKVISIYEQKKSGYINIVEKDFSQLFLTTCSNSKDKQLIIECKKINSD